MKLQERVTATVGRVQQADRELAAELAGKRERLRSEEASLEGVLEGLPGRGPEAVYETIVLSVGRPVLAIVRNQALLEIAEPESQVWKQRLTVAKPRLAEAIPAVGRVEVRNHPDFEWIGTGWLVDDDVVVTNRHVAREFGRGNGAGFVFRQGFPSGRMAASIDFLEEINREESLECRLERILHIEDDSGPDLAFLRVAPAPGQPLARRVELAETPAEPDEMVAVIGYPARDSRVPDQALMLRIFGDVFDKKRLAPGQITASSARSLLHDCSTLGGNSGSLVLSLGSGKAVGVHFAGRFAEANFAVPAHVVAERLADALRGEGRRRTPPAAAGRAAPLSAPAAGGRSVSVTVPIRITVDIGDVGHVGGDGRRTAAAAPATAAAGVEEKVNTGGDPADYVDREGYDATFLGDGLEVPLPAVTANAADVLEFELDGVTHSALRYQHFSVMMSRSRRLCLFSAVNIDGGSSRKKKRVAWRTDPRIPQAAQIAEECYGNPPRFSRGHMTRREDPVWGSSDTAALGNADSMHVTNAVPQMQPFNAPVWLGLEDYALDHARGDDMRLCVFTGPFLAGDDPVRFGVRIPVEFWKVIAFIHDDTGELCATGYTMSQTAFLQEEEFVFGQFGTAQVPIASIEQRAGLSFGPLAAVDPFEQLEEALPRTLTDFAQIRFVR